ncbi:Mut7-C RNAse domain-containing protein [Blastococcus capsensis]|uniref:Mut7-C RNAse domain-containing protein n=1 Tax=Blastococcus capsensis TaxID=1564163 RepID=UPI00253F7178|nr:Mut7-C RNAse domain-containing protein [Blastococcus capsensis]MDK3255058.1 Mut7-C RNAse domain-containing protein [Blastococcus capsensis]
MDQHVDVVVPPALRFLLPARDRPGGVRRLGFDPDATLGHLVRAAGVPPTEVGGLRLDGEPAPPAARARPGGTVTVEEIRRPQAAPSGGYLLDVGLGALARRLRLLGLDAAWSNRAEDADLVVHADAEERVLLTQDRGLLMRGAVVHGALVRGAAPDAQLADVLDRFAPAPAPLTRCTTCNGELRPVPKEQVAALLEPGTRRSYDEFSRCGACGRVYWRGAHARRIDELIGAARRRSG